MKNLKIHSLDNTYIDKDEVMLHACFQLLVDYVVKEWDSGKSEYFGGYFDTKKVKKDLTKDGYSKSHIKWEIASLEAQNKTTKEIWDLYNWWVNIRLKRDPCDMGKWDKKGNFLYDLEDEAMLIRLMRVRLALWT